jgi:hypothetical protein
MTIVLNGTTGITLPSSYEAVGFAPGTKMMFVQTAAPIGWTKDTSHDNKALRVVSGTASTGGSVAFTTAFSSNRTTSTVTVTGSVGSTTLAESQIPSHLHNPLSGINGDRIGQDGGGQGGWGLANGPNNNIYRTTTSSTGGGGSHNHSLSMDGHFHGTDLAVQYVDVIIATKD